MTETRIGHGTGEQAALFWELECGPLASRAFDVAPGSYTMESVATALRACHARLWLWWGEAGALVHVMVSEIRRRGDGTPIFHVDLVAGDGVQESIRTHWPVIRDWASAQGCRFMVFSGRPGWRRSGFLPGPVSNYWETVEVPLEGQTHA